jgi:hypothetical protein
MGRLVHGGIQTYGIERIEYLVTIDSETSLDLAAHGMPEFVEQEKIQNFLQR